MGKPVDLTGKVYGFLTVLSIAENKGKERCWNCKCECGNTVVVRRGNLTRGDTLSCGCYGRRKKAEANTKHGDYKTREYRIYNAMKARCNNPNSHSYELYGGRGIRVCQRWSDSYKNFVEDMGQCPSEKHSIERLDRNGDYCPSNCIWATQKEQSNNTSQNLVFSYGGKKYTLAQLSEISGINRYTLRHRLLRLAMTPDEAVSQPIGRWPKKDF